jgi:sugar phosphate isomerase/epimerase
MGWKRRELLWAGAAAWLARDSRPACGQERTGLPLDQRICLFTDHLDDGAFTWAEVAGMLRKLGVTGPDLTVRGGGLVVPERAAEDLPKAAAAFKAEGLSVPMLTTSLCAAADPGARGILDGMQSLGVQYFKLGYYGYGDAARWKERLGEVRTQLGGLLKLAERAGVQAGLHNHAGGSVGGALWDGWELLEPLDPARVGFFFDPAQATIEGGQHGWKLGFHRLAPRLKMVAIKDFVWERVDGRWRTRWVPLGEGMVRWEEFCSLLVRTPFSGPISLHIEYDPGGSTKQERYDRSVAAAGRDLKFLREQLKRASGELGKVGG